MIRTYIGTIGAGETKTILDLRDLQGLGMDQVRVKKATAINDAVGAKDLIIGVSNGTTNCPLEIDVGGVAAFADVAITDVQMSYAGLSDSDGISKLYLYAEAAAKYYVSIETYNR